AVLSKVPHWEAGTVATTWTVWLARFARSVGPKVRSLFASRENPPAAPSIDQVTLSARSSETVTPLALPGPLFVTVTVNPIWSPAENGPVRSEERRVGRGPRCRGCGTSAKERAL